MALVLNGSGTISGITAGGLPDDCLTAAEMPAGSVLQVAQGSTSTRVSVASGATADTGLTVNITPSSASSKILILVSQWCRKQSGATNAGITLTLKRDATSLNAHYLSGINGVNADARWIENIAYLDSPATTSQVTYKTTLNANYAAADVQFDSQPSQIIVMEIAG